MPHDVSPEYLRNLADQIEQLSAYREKYGSASHPDKNLPEKKCLFCENRYRGSAMYCSHTCALADDD